MCNQNACCKQRVTAEQKHAVAGNRVQVAANSEVSVYHHSQPQEALATRVELMGQ